MNLTAASTTHELKKSISLEWQSDNLHKDGQLVGTIYGWDWGQPSLVNGTKQALHVKKKLPNIRSSHLPNL